MTTLPVIGVMLTRPSREGLAVRAVLDFVAQTVPRKTLYVYTTDRDYATRLQRRFLAEADVHVCACATNTTPREMLREGLARAREAAGYVCLWDDDNRSNPGRLERQVAAADQADRPCFLSAGVWHFFDSDELFVYHLDRRHLDLRGRVVPGTMLARAAKVTDDLVPADAGGSPTAALGLAALQRYDAARPSEEWWWLVVGVRGDNAGGYEFHRRWATNPDRCHGRAWVVENQVVLRHWLDQYAWDAPRLDVCGHDGVAVRFEPKTLWGPDVPPVGEPEGVERVREALAEDKENAE